MGFYIYLVLCLHPGPHIIALMHRESVIITHAFIPSSGHPDASVLLLPKHKFIVFSPAFRVGASVRRAAAIRRP